MFTQNAIENFNKVGIIGYVNFTVETEYGSGGGLFFFDKNDKMWAEPNDEENVTLNEIGLCEVTKQYIDENNITLKDIVII